MKYCLERDEMGPLEFEGTLLAVAHTDTAATPKDHWTELAIYAVSASESRVRWVVQSTGHTRVPGEDVRHRAVACETPEEVGNALSSRDVRSGGRVRLFGVGYKVMDLAADKDDELDEWLDEYMMKTKEVIR